MALISTTGIRAELQVEVEQFLYHEAWLLDERRLYEWLELFTDDARYVMQVREKALRTADGSTPASGIPTAPVRFLFQDDKAFLSLRIRRLDTGMAHVEKPASITRHLVANVQVVQEDGDEVVVRSGFQVYQARLERDDQVFYGKREDRLRRVDGTWRIAHRTTTLDHVTVPRTLTIFF